ncbi:unnamed protein product [Ceratitis capitata]|uniref:(Mediterranean fruit fly) hypothetical protein n=1 Tax=Ceratitis capitata TaxID=7213 RepID=A0A811U8W8_CERCA|nr:unnamed protein product [Ceratitis capitata]
MSVTATAAITATATVTATVTTIKTLQEKRQVTATTSHGSPQIAIIANTLEVTKSGENGVQLLQALIRKSAQPKPVTHKYASVCVCVCVRLGCLFLCSANGKFHAF